MTIQDICSPDQIEPFIRGLEADYQDNPGLILSEHDLQCLLFAKIREYLVANNNMKLRTHDDHYASPVHTEISFLDEDKKLRIRPDITLLEPSSLTLTDLDDKLVEKKGFSFSNSAFVIELKFCKDPQGITKEFAQWVEEDCHKILELHALHPQSDSAQEERIRGMVVVFSRRDQKSPCFDKLMERYSTSHHAVQLIYATSKFHPQPG